MTQKSLNFPKTNTPWLISYNVLSTSDVQFQLLSRNSLRNVIIDSNLVRLFKMSICEHFCLCRGKKLYQSSLCLNDLVNYYSINTSNWLVHAE